MPGPQLYGKPAFIAKPGPDMSGPYRSVISKLLNNFQPDHPGFSGWNWQPRTLPWLAAAQISRPP